MPGLCKLLKSLGYLGQLRCGLRQEVPWFKSRLSNWIRIGVWESSPPIAEFFYIYYTDLHPEVIAMLTGCYLEWYMMLDGKNIVFTRSTTLFGLFIMVGSCSYLLSMYDWIIRNAQLYLFAGLHMTMNCWCSSGANWRWPTHAHISYTSFFQHIKIFLMLQSSHVMKNTSISVCGV
jgi:hypothetical protein